MKYLLSFLLFVLITQNKVDAQRHVTYSDKNFSYTLIIDSIITNRKSYSLDSNIKSIIITHLKDNKIIQKIIPEYQEYRYSFFKGNFILKDMNFDGNNDIQLLENSKGMNSSYLCWLFNPLTVKFEENKELENITSPQIDSANKQITSSWKGSAGLFGYAIYQYKNEKYHQIESRELNRYNDEKDSVLFTIRKRIKDKVIITQKKYYANEEFERLQDSLCIKP